MRFMNAVIIDDAKNSIEAMQAKLERHCPQVKVIATFTDPLQAIEELSLINPDVVFLDIEMPQMDGFELLRRIKNNKAKIVFVTAYNHYAIQAIRAHAFDYLEKPVDIKLLKETIMSLEKELEKKEKENPVTDLPQTMDELVQSIRQLQAQQQIKNISLATTEGIHIIQLSEIVRLEALSNYTKFFLSDGKQLLVSKTMGEYDEMLLKNNFFRIHRSHMINLRYLRTFHKNESGTVELRDGTILEVSDRKKKELLQRLTDITSQ